MRVNSGAGGDEEFDAILRGGRFEPVFQPIREMDHLQVVGYEALVRGPAGSRYRGAGALLEEAYRTGRVVEFDWAARVSACRAAMAAGLRPGRLLFLNIEPLALKSDTPPDFAADIAAAFERYQIVLEITERSLERDPRSLLEGIDYQRPNVAGLALDDLDTRWAAASMLPLLSVDLIKLDRSVTQAGTSPAAMKALDIALEESERTGATLLSEGIEGSDDINFVRAIGADLGQRHLLGEPAPLRPEWEDEAQSWSLVSRPGPSPETRCSRPSSTMTSAGRCGPQANSTEQRKSTAEPSSWPTSSRSRSSRPGPITAWERRCGPLTRRPPDGTGNARSPFTTTSTGSTPTPSGPSLTLCSARPDDLVTVGARGDTRGPPICRDP
jgi:EAL domain-containing protein (putative c-di-GMP-specific phosphodiesterase class I)